MIDLAVVRENVTAISKELHAARRARRCQISETNLSTNYPEVKPLRATRQRQ